MTRCLAPEMRALEDSVRPRRLGEDDYKEADEGPMLLLTTTVVVRGEAESVV